MTTPPGRPRLRSAMASVSPSPRREKAGVRPPWAPLPRQRTRRANSRRQAKGSDGIDASDQIPAATLAAARGRRPALTGRARHHLSTLSIAATTRRDFFETAKASRVFRLLSELRLYRHSQHGQGEGFSHQTRSLERRYLDYRNQSLSRK